MEAAIAAAIVAIIGGVVSTGINIYQMGVQHVSSNVRKYILELSKLISSELKSGRIKVNKLLSLIQSKNQSALLTYLYNNPIISKRLDEMQSNSDLVASLQADQTNLEMDINNLQTELSQLGYNTTINAANRDKDRGKEIEKEIQSKKQEYDRLGRKVEQASEAVSTTTQNSSTYTGDLDARSQNIEGGLVK